MAALSLRHHMDITHRIVLPKTGGVDFGRGVPEIYVVSFPRVLKLVDFLVDICPERENKSGSLIEHFMYLH